MPYPKIFIGSSKSAMPIAKQFVETLQGMMAGKLEVVPWWEDPQGQGASELAYLLDRSRDCDFAAILLTKDDQVRKRARLMDAPRDNCVFESGLFTGAFSAQNRDQARCFLLTSLKTRADLPSDLAGIRVLEIEDTPSSPKLEKAAESVKRAINELGSLVRPELVCIGEKRLMEREQLATSEMREGWSPGPPSW